MSTLEVGKIVPATGTAITLGETGDTLTVPSGATLAIASGATLNATGATQTGFSSGLTAASQWRLTTNFTGAAAPIASNLEEVDAPVGFGVLGSSMTESSGIFTFPSTGYWLIDFHSNCTAAANVFYRNIRIFTTTNNSTYVEAANGYSAVGISAAGTWYWGADARYIFDVTDTANCKVQFQVQVSGGTVTTVGNTDYNQTYMTFLMLADT